MGWFDSFLRFLGLIPENSGRRGLAQRANPVGSTQRAPASPSGSQNEEVHARYATSPVGMHEPPASGAATRPRRRPRLTTLRYRAVKRSQRHADDHVETVGIPYKYARYGSATGRYLDLARDSDDDALRRHHLPVFHNPEELAAWLRIPVKSLAWLTHRFTNGRPVNWQKAHYHYRWLKKKSGGWRLIEAPKPLLRQAQDLIQSEILNLVSPHIAAHGFVIDRNIVSNAQPHVGQFVVVKFDLANFYATVKYSRVVAIFRSMGYSREAAIWLGLLTTSAISGNQVFPEKDPYAVLPYLPRHLPQGAPTSPALANLSAFSLDVRLSGLARRFGAHYTRYADDLTFSGDEAFARSLKAFIPLTQQIIRQERFQFNGKKRRILRRNQRQSVTGVVVNDRPNLCRHDVDLLKAILTNCIRLGPASQNREQHADFQAHLLGRIGHLKLLNPTRAHKLLKLFQQINWQR